MAFYSDSHGYMGFPNDFSGNMFQREPTHFNSYANGYSHVVPRCHICGFEGHTPAEYQQRNYSTQNCLGMNFAQQHGSYHNNYSDGWPPNQMWHIGTTARLSHRFLQVIKCRDLGVERRANIT